MGDLLRRLRYWVRQRKLEQDLHEEIEFHRALKQQELEADGMSSADARLAARRELGNVTRAQEEARAQWIWPWLESVWQDTTYAARSLRRQPGFTLVSVGVLGVAIGLNASLFTVFAGLALRPMAGLADPESVVTVTGANPRFANRLFGMSFPEFRFLATESKTFVGLAAERNASVSLESGGVGRTIVAHAVTGNYFDVLGVRMEHGRGFVPDEDRRDSLRPVVVLSYGLWQTQFGGNAAVVGTTVRLNDIPHTVVGIASREFAGSEGGASRVWVPLSLLPALRPNDPFDANLLDRPDCCVNVIGRLGAATREQARAELQVLSDRFRASVAQESRPIAVGGTQFLRGRGNAGTAVAIIGALFIGIVLVLLIACANIGNLLLARAAARASEVAVRLSLGAGRARIVRQLLTEGFVLALIGSAVGVALATYLPPFVLNELAGQPAPFDIAPDGLVLAYAVVLAAIACVAFALAPALHATRADVSVALKTAAMPSRSSLRLRTILLGIQVAVTVVLLTSAGLLLRGVSQARLMDLGFRVDGVAVATIELPQPAYDTVRAQALLADLMEGLRAGGLSSFGVVSIEPWEDLRFVTGLRLPGEREDQARPIDFFDVSPGYFDVLGLQIVAGRGFVAADAGRNVAIVNETTARQYWPGTNPVGQTFFDGGSRSIEIVGVVSDARIHGPEAIQPLFFQPMAGARGPRFPKLLFESEPSSTALVTTLVERLERRARVNVTPLGDRLEEQLAELALAPLAASVLGLFGLGVATVGMFGVFAYVARQRTREIGIRIALGAQPGEIIRLVLAGSSRAVIAGLGVGVLGSLGASQLLRGSLYGVSPLDPLTFAGVTLLLAASAMAASYLPARRAARIDPTQALRAD